MIGLPMCNAVWLYRLSSITETETYLMSTDNSLALCTLALCKSGTFFYISIPQRLVEVIRLQALGSEVTGAFVVYDNCSILARTTLLKAHSYNQYCPFRHAFVYEG